jgi:hypothetical protein
MSQSLDIFVNSDELLVTLVQELESLLGIQFQLRSRQDESWYEAATPNLVLTLGEHEFENDRELNFEDYRYAISLRPIRYKTEVQWHQIRNEAAQRIFQALKAMNKYHLMLVDDVQVKLAEFHPTSTVEAVPAI